MIAFLRGQLVAMEEDTVTLEVHGVGYLVHVSQQTRSQLPRAGSEIFLHTCLEVREDGWTLFGFSSPEESTLFRMLRNVSGIGPKTALNILSGIGPADLQQAILFEDTARLSRLPGIGKKTAQRLILELRDKLKTETINPTEVTFTAGGSQAAESSPILQAREALIELGYSDREAHEALQHVQRQEDGQVPELETILRKALAYLARAQSDGRSLS